MSGLPRSGSTAIASVLNQNPLIHAGPNSPMCGMMWNLERSILASEQWNAYPKHGVLPSVIMGVLENYYSDIDASLVIDKCRDWATPENFELLKRNMTQEPKIIMTVRSITEILASFIALVRVNSQTASFIDKEIEISQMYNHYRDIDEIRCDHLMRPKGLIDNAMFGIANALTDKNKKNFLFLEFQDFVNDPNLQIKRIYDFLELEHFSHDINFVKNKFHENDSIYGLNGMHDVRLKVSPSNTKPEEILPPYIIQKYSNMEFWRK